MLFNSFEFLIFLPIVIILYFLLPQKARWVMLLAASYYFYMAWKPEYIILIILSTLVDYTAGILMEKQPDKKKRKVLMYLSLITNLGLLFVFKYFNFFNQELGKIYEMLSNKNYSIAGLSILLPMGISFYTFQTLSYTIDVYRGKRTAERHLGYFALYVSFFPQLVAGPIERSDRLLPQLKQNHTFDFDNTMNSLLRISWGFFKKVVIADRVAVIVNTVYNDVHSYSGMILVVATIGFAIQIYCDFSAYSDIAIGSANLMGIKLMENFKMPYFSKSVTEFWSRWHISLSSWFKDYLYIPLGGNRMDKKWKVYKNILIVFIVSGFWHGANWTFLAWGALHGIWLVVEKLIDQLRTKKKEYESYPILKTMVTFGLVVFAWIFFRANNIADAKYVISHLGPDNITVLYRYMDLGLDEKDVRLLVMACILLFSTDYIRYRYNKPILIKGYFKQGLTVVALILIILILGYYGNNIHNEFIYFQF